MNKKTLLDSLLPLEGPFSIKEGNEINIRKGKSLQVVNLVVFFLALILVVMRSVVEGTFPPHNITTVYIAPLFILSIFLFKKKGMFKTAIWFLTFSGYLAITLRLLHAGGLSSANVVLYTIFPLCSYVFLNDRVYIFQTALCILTLIGFYIFMPYGLHGNIAVESPFIKLYIIVLCLIIDVGIIWTNEVFREEYHKKMQKLEKQSVGIKIVSALNHELINPLNLLKGSFQIAKKERDEEWFERCEKSINRLEDKIVELNQIVNKYELRDKDTRLSSIETIKSDLES